MPIPKNAFVLEDKTWDKLKEVPFKSPNSSTPTDNNLKKSLIFNENFVQ